MEKIRNIWERCMDYKIWLGLLLISDAIFGLFLWLADIRAFWELAGLILLFSVLLFGAAAVWTCRRESRFEDAVTEYLNRPDKEQEEEAISALSARERREIRLAAELLRGKEERLREQAGHLEGYEEFIESWAHEIKTPLALMTLLLDNRKGEIEPDIHKRLEYARNQMQGYVDRILIYARLKAVHKDYLLEEVSVAECIGEVLSEYEMLLHEAGFRVTADVADAKAYTDRKSFCFILSQIVSNSIKYTRRDVACPELVITTRKSAADKKLLLILEDNGAGIREGDLPFIFDKGFSGDAGGQRKKSSGMGLYLAGQLADELKIGIDVQSSYKKGTRFTLAL
ncbi:two-component sensor histidine kinase [Lachnospiraceae bacterium]|uniref:sensor histidine kinase n=1 Tax=Extibacter sp. GGCC_0201 TaxID=2731209 RepID=UPI001AA113FA|nr:sensor histidine kinase [Extibacter sp. GGCC_0201]MBO1722278.1 sensor histidine kinase [Extibacter sp. GGCC_0201]BDF32322.1 two-component sensor histidine kinase [Lachnospiraceae bacterium]BDF36332.1 two-component sensor histidine kinase [Lachnospiraceae bacterium]